MSSITFEDDTNPITNPFYYAQNMDAVYELEYQKLQNQLQEEQLKNIEANKHEKEAVENKKKKSRLSLKKTICKPASTSSCTSYVVRKESGKAHHLIKISIEDTGTLCGINSDIKNVSVQYLVKDNYDDIMEDTERLISKVVKKISSCNEN